MKLTVVIPNYADHLECNATVRSVLDTAVNPPAIIVVDDGSPTPFVSEASEVLVIRNRHRCGVGPSRHIGVLAAKTQMILLLDSHCRMTPGWDAALISSLEEYPKRVVCGVCLGLDANNMDMNAPKGVYHGATINVHGLDKQSKIKRMQVFEAIWNREAMPSGQLAACMGACYASHRDWFLHIDPLRHLRSWAEDEIMLSVKSWLAGGEVWLNTDFRVGHKFRLSSQRIPFTLPAEDLTFNKLFAIHTLLPPNVSTSLLMALRRSGCFVKGDKAIKRSWSLVATEQARNAQIFTRDFHWLAEKFSLKLP